MIERRIFYSIAFSLAMCCGLFFALTSPSSAFAASIDFSPLAKAVTVGQAFTVIVNVSSADQAMNAVSGDISFPSDKLQVLSISKTNSIIGLWVRDPSFSNSVVGGDVHFEGIVLNPGFQGSGGDVIRVTFEAVAPGVASLMFSSGSVLANDGNGTNILNSLGTASISIAPKPIVQIAPAQPVSSTSAGVGSGGEVAPTSSPTSTIGANVVPICPTIPPAPPIDPVTQFLSAWGWMIIAILLMLVILLAGVIIWQHYRLRLRSAIVQDRKKYHEDLMKFEKELESDQQGLEIDLSAEGIHKRQEHLRREIERLEAGIKKYLKS
jgi:hypothetical protein